MMKNKKRKYISLVVFVGIYIALIVFIIYPLLTGISEDSKELISVKEEKAFFSEGQSSLHDLRDYFCEVEPNLNKIEGLFINKDVPIEFIDYLRWLADYCGVSIEMSSVNFEEKGEEDTWSFYYFNVDVGGNYGNLIRFIEKLENSQYLVEVYELNVGKREDESSPNDYVEASLLLKAFTR